MKEQEGEYSVLAFFCPTLHEQGLFRKFLSVMVKVSPCDRI
jgi:hypothetical protein